jgi:flagellar assembly factor FliW
MTAASPLYSFRVSLDSVLFGHIAVAPDACFTLPDGLLGFAAEHRFALLPAASDAYWLQGLNNEALVFLVVDPFRYVPGYSLELSPDTHRELGDRDPTRLVVLAIVTLPREAGELCTANLQGPVVLDTVTRLGWQVVLGESAYGVRHPISLEAVASSSAPALR